VNNEISLIEQGFFCEFAFEVRTLSNSNLNFVTSLLKRSSQYKTTREMDGKMKKVHTGTFTPLPALTTAMSAPPQRNPGYACSYYEFGLRSSIWCTFNGT